jgi:ATP-dependent Lon protease
MADGGLDERGEERYGNALLDDRFEQLEADIKDLYKRTNYEQVKFFRYMNDQITKNSKGVAYCEGQVKAVSDLIHLRDKHAEDNLCVALELELYPIIQERFQAYYGEFIRERFSHYVTTNEFQTRFNAFYATFKETATNQEDFNEVVRTDMASTDVRIRTITESFCTLEKLEKSLYYYTETAKFDAVARRLENYTLKRDYNDKTYKLDEQIHALDNLIKGQYYRKEDMDSKLLEGDK